MHSDATAGRVPVEKREKKKKNLQMFAALQKHTDALSVPD